MKQRILPVIVLFMLCTMSVPILAQDEKQLTVSPKGQITLRKATYNGYGITFDVSSVDTRKSKGIIPIGLAALAPNFAFSRKPSELNQKGKNGFNTLPVNLSIFSSIAAFKLFSRNAILSPIVEISIYSNEGKPIETKYLNGQPSDGKLIFNYHNQADLDGYALITIFNKGKKNLVVSGQKDFQLSPKSSSDTLEVSENDKSTNVHSSMRSEVPIGGGEDDYFFGGTYAAVTITAPSDNESYRYTSDFGTLLTSDWALSPAEPSGGDGGGGSGDGGSAEAPPELKQQQRQINQLLTNECEVRYIADHMTDVPTMAFTLWNNKKTVTDNCEFNGFGEANSDGAAPENAYKHALITAVNVCSLGEQHAMAIAGFHENCNGDQNPTVAEGVMDTFNNARGLDIVRVVGCSDLNAITFAIIDAYNDGILHKIDGTGTP